MKAKKLNTKKNKTLKNKFPTNIENFKHSNKILVKKSKKPNRTNSSNNISCKEECQSYLIQWKNHRDAWTFKKNRQVWLLKHMYDSDEVSDEYFEIMLEYIEGLKGLARETTIKNSEAVLDNNEMGDSSHNSQFERIKKVLQILS